MISPSELCVMKSLGGVVALSRAESASEPTVREVAILDVEPLTGAYGDFHAGDAVFTSLGFSGGRAELIDEAMASLLARDVACIFIKDALPYEPSAEVLGESRRRRIPLFRYREGLLEQIISEARQLIAESAREDRMEAALRGLMAGPGAGSVARAVAEATGLSGTRLQAAALSVAESDGLALAALRSHVAAELRARGAAECCCVMRFGASVLVLAASDGSMEERPLLGADCVSALIAGFGSGACAGYSQAVAFGEAPDAIREAEGCLVEARRRGRATLSWEDMGPAAFSVARGDSALLGRACEAGLSRLRKWDGENSGNLEESLRAYVEAAGKVEAAAERLSQHPNSLRNRLARARTVLSMEEATDKELFAYLAMIYL